ncbi:hypothetical protein SISNIDRAFT_437511 [Sistotremastrum niveocremeum HHB9708]|uniref:Uncharacterized protein n=2 Tax=Sistotremastraceae TaxID=3402574 RepID=A0A164Y8P6_9AGAM|nr:hypothetical protein SISNIDRAFT_437511 [Sistotremastrum niveocremeum HHB9708]KZT42383.1 hypothetical protein SISSUDRAFT_1016170 [Sistotremastrum suecicum HHB10207 ss-3]
MSSRIENFKMPSDCPVRLSATPRIPIVDPWYNGTEKLSRKETLSATQWAPILENWQEQAEAICHSLEARKGTPTAALSDSCNRDPPNKRSAIDPLLQESTTEEPKIDRRVICRPKAGPYHNPVPYTLISPFPHCPSPHATRLSSEARHALQIALLESVIKDIERWEAAMALENNASCIRAPRDIPFVESPSSLPGSPSFDTWTSLIGKGDDDDGISDISTASLHVAQRFNVKNAGHTPAFVPHSAYSISTQLPQTVENEWPPSYSFGIGSGFVRPFSALPVLTEDVADFMQGHLLSGASPWTAALSTTPLLTSSQFVGFNNGHSAVTTTAGNSPDSSHLTVLDGDREPAFDIEKYQSSSPYGVSPVVHQPELFTPKAHRPHEYLAIHTPIPNQPSSFFLTPSPRRSSPEVIEEFDEEVPMILQGQPMYESPEIIDISTPTLKGITVFSPDHEMSTLELGSSSDRVPSPAISVRSDRVDGADDDDQDGYTGDVDSDDEVDAQIPDDVSVPSGAFDEGNLESILDEASDEATDNQATAVAEASMDLGVLPYEIVQLIIAFLEAPSTATLVAFLREHLGIPAPLYSSGDSESPETEWDSESHADADMETSWTTLPPDDNREWEIAKVAPQALGKESHTATAQVNINLNVNVDIVKVRLRKATSYRPCL